MSLRKLRLDFSFTDISQHFALYMMVFVLKFFIHHHSHLSGKDLNLFEECAAESVHLCPQEE